ncbi:MAG: winged helix-turn-helix transcriptional regulator [Cyclobacteriaceae bacterium]
MSKTCIRVLADPVQIKECKQAIQSLEEPLADVTRVFNLAGNAARLKILYLLSREGEMCPCDFSDILEISVGGVSQHLRKLKDGGLVQSKKVGQTVFYSIPENKMTMLNTLIELLIQKEKHLTI